MERPPRGVVKHFENASNTFAALRGVDLKVEPGEFVAVIGKSGGGKSTLLNIIAGIDRPTSGDSGRVSATRLLS